jgi:hypothetical protein
MKKTKNMSYQYSGWKTSKEEIREDNIEMDRKGLRE